MSVSDTIMSLLPEKYRRDIAVLGLGIGLAASGLHLEGRIDTAYAAAEQTKTLQQQIVDLKTQQQLMSAQSATNQSNIQATKAEVDMLVQHLLNAQPLPTAPAVTAKKVKKP